MLEGEKILVGGEEMIMPPLNIKAIKKFYGDITAGINPENGLDPLIELVFSALVRNYPELTLDEFSEKASLVELNAALPKLLAISGFMAKQPGESKGSAKRQRGTR